MPRSRPWAPRPWDWWTQHKLQILEDYLQAFVTTTKNKASERIYLDLSDGRTVSFRHPYCFDVHWSDLIVLAPGQSALARAELYLDKHLVASGDTGWHALA